MFCVCNLQLVGFVAGLAVPCSVCFFSGRSLLCFVDSSCFEEAVLSRLTWTRWRAMRTCRLGIHAWHATWLCCVLIVFMTCMYGSCFIHGVSCGVHYPCFIFPCMHACIVVRYLLLHCFHACWSSCQFIHACIVFMHVGHVGFHACMFDHTWCSWMLFSCMFSCCLFNHACMHAWFMSWR